MIKSIGVRSSRKKYIGRRTLLTCAFEITQRCNFDCVHCFVRQPASCVRSELSTAQIFDILKKLHAFGLLFLQFTGGEPLAHPDFSAIYRFAKKLRFAVSVSTNASLITPGIIALFKSLPPAGISVSAYGFSKKTFESVTRVSGSFEAFKRGVSLLKSAGLPFVSRLVIMKNNLADLDQFMPEATEGSGRSFEQRFTYLLALRRDGDPARNRRIRSQRLSGRQYRMLFEKLGRFMPSECDTVDYCGAGSIGCTITATGSMIPCYYLARPSADLLRNGLPQAWQAIRLPMDPPEQKKRACHDCRHRHRCPWCPGLAFLENGSCGKKVKMLCRLAEAVCAR